MSVDVDDCWDLADVFGLDDAEPAEIVLAPPSSALPAKVSPQEALLEIEEQVFAKHLAIVAAAGRFPEVDPASESNEPPEAWVRELGLERAQERFRVARAAWLPTSAAPAGLALSQRVVASMTKARALREASKGSGASLNVTFAIFPAPQYERIEVVGGD